MATKTTTTPRFLQHYRGFEITRLQDGDYRAERQGEVLICPSLSALRSHLRYLGA